MNIDNHGVVLADTSCLPKNALTKAVRHLSLIGLIAIALMACQTSVTSPGGPPAGSPLPSLPGGSAGSPSTPSDSEPSPPTPSSEGSESGSESESSSSAESGGEAGAGEEGEPPPGWEDDTSIAEGEAGSADEGEEGEVTFEEPEIGEGDVSFEEPDFDDGGGLTQEELEELERELNESLGDFDEDIQREKTYAEERANDDTGSEPLGGVGTFESYEGDEEASGESSSSSAQSASGQSASDSSESSTAQSSSESAENAGEVSGDAAATGEQIEQNNEDVTDASPDIPEDIADDDIVARQIREAAENELDPELKEKLWAEYRKYKNQ